MVLHRFSMFSLSLFIPFIHNSREFICFHARFFHIFLELDNWFLEQMAAVATKLDVEPGTSSSSESVEAGIKRTYAEKMKANEKQLRALNEQLRATQYIIGQLRIHGIPSGTTPKEYVQQLLMNRNTPNVHDSRSSGDTRSETRKP